MSVGRQVRRPLAAFLGPQITVSQPAPAVWPPRLVTVRWQVLWAPGPWTGTDREHRGLLPQDPPGRLHPTREEPSEEFEQESHGVIYDFKRSLQLPWGEMTLPSKNEGKVSREKDSDVWTGEEGVALEVVRLARFRGQFDGNADELASVA